MLPVDLHVMLSVPTWLKIYIFFLGGGGGGGGRGWWWREGEVICDWLESL